MEKIIVKIWSLEFTLMVKEITCVPCYPYCCIIIPIGETGPTQLKLNCCMRFSSSLHYSWHSFNVSVAVDFFFLLLADIANLL